MQRKVKPNCAQPQTDKSNITPEVEKLKKQVKRLQAQNKKSINRAESWKEIADNRIEEIREKKDIISEFVSKAEVWRNSIKIQKLQLDVSLQQTKMFRSLLEEHTKELSKDREDKLIAHGLVSGKSKVLTKCDSCSLNGNCKFQEIYKGLGVKKVPEICTGPFPMDADDKIRIAQFPLDQVNYWENSDLKN